MYDSDEAKAAVLREIRAAEACRPAGKKFAMGPRGPINLQKAKLSLSGRRWLDGYEAKANVIDQSN